MGLCFSDCCYIDNKNYIKHEIIYKNCYKCNDTFKIHTGGFSERKSCRHHNFDNNGVCIDCHNNKDNLTSYTCYHVKKFGYFNF